MFETGAQFSPFSTPSWRRWRNAPDEVPDKSSGRFRFLGTAHAFAFIRIKINLP